MELSYVTLDKVLTGIHVVHDSDIGNVLAEQNPAIAAFIPEEGFELSTIEVPGYASQSFDFGEGKAVVSFSTKLGIKWQPQKHEGSDAEYMLRSDLNNLLGQYMKNKEQYRSMIKDGLSTHHDHSPDGQNQGGELFVNMLGRSILQVGNKLVLLEQDRYSELIIGERGENPVLINPANGLEYSGNETDLIWIQSNNPYEIAGDVDHQVVAGKLPSFLVLQMATMDCHNILPQEHILPRLRDKYGL